jgi:transcriptional regulator of acetoin/glycerol metabolism
MASTGCACKRIDQIESELIRTRARLAQLFRELREIRDELHLAEFVEKATVTIKPLAVVERRAILAAVEKHPPLHAAKTLGIGKTTLYRKLTSYGRGASELRKIA